MPRPVSRVMDGWEILLNVWLAEVLTEKTLAEVAGFGMEAPKR